MTHSIGQDYLSRFFPHPRIPAPVCRQVRERACINLEFFLYSELHLLLSIDEKHVYRMRPEESLMKVAEVGCLAFQKATARQLFRPTAEPSFFMEVSPDSDGLLYR